ncbi:MAG: transporter substrate-binding domain-containing protein [Gammaproteobacteria bacterium]|nr:transporter substrate-binding domain-containing protein [Gammaproteobacteria bacterium]MDH4315984.1 transporter substrate-binding domain-containing protein [Gammaproteobacteria bacterium]MDH5214448.1 transporter substrate-binding domain-containing protein [Gammaproteobacteria bacterium]
MLRLLVTITTLIFMLAAEPATARSLDEILKDGTIRIGVNPNFPPMSSYGMTNQLEGFDVDIADRIAKSLGVKLELVTTEAAQRVPFLLSNRIDIALGALTRTPERAKLISFTVPLHSESMGVITTDKVAAQSWEDLNNPDITLVNMRGNLSVAILKDKLPKAKTLLVDGNADTIRAIAQGRADALVENVDFFLNFTNNYKNVNWRVLDEPIFVAYCGIGVSKGNDSLREYLDVLLYDLHTSGDVNALWTKWYGGPMAVPIVPNPYF